MLDGSALRFEKSLQLFDPLLSLRWGPTIQQWVVQRKSFLGEGEMQFLSNERRRMKRKIDLGKATPSDLDRYNGIAEEHDCSLEQKRVILFVKDFSPQVFDILALGDIKRYGGYSRYSDAQDEKARLVEVREEREKSNKLYDLNMEMFGKRGVYDFLQQRRQTELGNGERDVKKLLGLKSADWEKEKRLVDERGKLI